MLHSEIVYELSLPYDDLVSYLIKKYGSVKGTYFYTSQCCAVNKKNTRTSDGLYRHHIMEKYVENISSPAIALEFPFEYQFGENLVYCNLIEHLILHIKIMVFKTGYRQYKSSDLISIIPAGVSIISNDVNSLFFDTNNITDWRIPSYNAISDNYNDYIIVLKVIVAFLKHHCKNYTEYNHMLSIGGSFTYKNKAYTVLSAMDASDCFDKSYEVIDNEGETSSLNCSRFLSMTNPCQASFYYICRELSSHSGIVDKRILGKLFPNVLDEQVEKILSRMYDDYPVYYNSSFDKAQLDFEKFGSKTISEYIGNAFHLNTKIPDSVLKSEPHFWSGEMPKNIQNTYYFIRVSAIFFVKRGKKPFISIYDSPDSNSKLCNELAFKYYINNVDTQADNYTHKPVIITSSRFYNSKFYNSYKDNNGKIRCYKMTLTFTKDDYNLFIDTYKVFALTVLDGCYFE